MPMLSVQQDLEKARNRLARLDVHSAEITEMEQKLEDLRAQYWYQRDALSEESRPLPPREPKPRQAEILQAATLPDAPIGPPRAQAAAGILACAFLAGTLLALIRERLDDTVKTEEDLMRKCDLPVLATVTAREFNRCI